MKNLYKDQYNRVLFGVCSGLSDYTSIDVSLLRILFIIGTLFSGTLLFWIYLLLAIVLPNKDTK